MQEASDDQLMKQALPREWNAPKCPMALRTTTPTASGALLVMTLTWIDLSGLHCAGVRALSGVAASHV